MSDCQIFSNEEIFNEKRKWMTVEGGVASGSTLPLVSGWDGYGNGVFRSSGWPFLEGIRTVQVVWPQCNWVHLQLHWQRGQCCRRFEQGKFVSWGGGNKRWRRRASLRGGGVAVPRHLEWQSASSVRNWQAALGDLGGAWQRPGCWEEYFAECRGWRGGWQNCRWVVEWKVWDQI